MFRRAKKLHKIFQIANITLAIIATILAILTLLNPHHNIFPQELNTIISTIIAVTIPYFLFLHLRTLREKHQTEKGLQQTKRILGRTIREDDMLKKQLETDIKTIEKNRETLRNSQVIVDNVIDAVIQVNNKGIIKSLNHTAEKIFGYSQKEILGKSINTLIPDNDSQIRIKHLEEFNKKGTSKIIGVNREIFAKHKDGHTFPIEIGISPIKINRRKSFVAIIRDITEKKKAEERLNQYTDQLDWTHFEMQHARLEAERANQAKSMFLANMSHEIRTPLNGVLGMTELLLNTEMDEKQEKFANYIYTSGNALMELINDILDFSKIEAGEMKLESIPFDLRKKADEVINIFEPKAEKIKIGLKLSYPSNVPSQVIGDPTRIKQVLINLLGNSIKFTPKGKIELKIKQIKKTKTTATISFEVADTGIGIPKEQLNNIFDKFAQADTSTTRKFGGTGLGLAICKQLVDLMKGKIQAESTEGKGSKFTFEVPLKLQNIK